MSNTDENKLNTYSAVLGKIKAGNASEVSPEEWALFVSFLEEQERASEEKSETIARLKDDVMQKNLELFLSAEAQEKEKENEKRISDELSHIKNSNSYQFLLPYFRARDFLFPENSKRRDALQHILHPLRYGKTEDYGQENTLHKDVVTPCLPLPMDSIRSNDGNTEAAHLVHFNMAKRDSYPKLVLPKESENPLVSIIIPVYNQFSYTYGCLEAIIANTQGFDYEVIIGDDCSTDETSHIQDYVENVVVARNEFNTRFLLNCRNAVKYAKGKYLFFLNNDTNVQPNWLGSLLDTLEVYPNAGIVGSKLVYPDGKLQEAGGILWRDASAWNYGNRQNPEASEFNYRKPADYISGAAILVSRNVWDEVGGFDTLFYPAYCEDSDLAFAVRKAGYEVIYDPFSVVIHYEGVSNGTNTASGVKKYQVDNTEKFYTKWKDTLAKHYPNAENVFKARDRSYDKKTVLVIDHYVPMFDKDAGSRTMFLYLRILADLGYNVKFLGENCYRHEPYTYYLQRLGIEVLYGPYYYNHLEEWLQNNGKYIDYVLFSRPHITIKFIDVIEKYCTNAKTMYYGHDLHYVRVGREYELSHDEKLKEEADYWKKTEFSIYDKVNLVLYPTEPEKKLLLEENPGMHVETLQAYAYTKIGADSYKPEKRKDILFVGGFGHKPNLDGILWFISNAFPEFQKKNPSAKLIIAGSNPPEELLKLASASIDVKGFVSDEELEKLYDSVRLVVVPLRYGAGIKGKVIEAMSFGVPVITTSCGAEGINTNAFAVDDTMASLGKLYTNYSQLSKMSQQEAEYIKAEYSYDSAKMKFQKLMDKLSEE